MPDPGQIVLLQAPDADAMLLITARLALAGPLYVLDAGNRFDAYRVARLVRQQATAAEPALGRIRVARAFTCYQVVALFEQTAATTVPCLVFDLLATFYDENVPLPESYRLLRLVLGHLQRLRRAAPVVLSLYPPRRAERAVLARAVMDAADRLLTWESPPAPPPATLF